MWIRTLVALATFLFLLTPVSAIEWGTYTNHEYKFKIDYPLEIFATRTESTNGSGITMKSEDGVVEFRAYAFENAAKLPMKEVQQIIVEENDGREITYKRIKNNWIVISGYEWEGDQRLIFYQRLAASKDESEFSVFEMIYPENRRTKFDPLLKRMSLSLTAPG